MHVEEKQTKRRNICWVPEAGNVSGAVSSKALSTTAVINLWFTDSRLKIPKICSRTHGPL